MSFHFGSPRTEEDSTLMVWLGKKNVDHERELLEVTIKQQGVHSQSIGP